MVRTFDKSMIQAFLNSVGLRYLVDNDGDYMVQFSYDSQVDCELAFWFLIGGSKRDIYTVMAASSKRIPRSEWGRALQLCNDWNRERRWPKSYLVVKDPRSDLSGEIRLEEQIDLGKGIHQELFDDFSMTVIVTANEFWKWAKQQGL